MSAAKHTPGPWRYELLGGDRHIRAGDGQSLQCDTKYYPWVSDNEADWHLIAAAPELLEGCKAFLDYLRGPTAWTQEQENELAHSICAVIAKAARGAA